jgi:hypothetical protein
MADKDYMLSDGTVITEKVAERIVQDVYDAVDRGDYKVITDTTKKTPPITIPSKEIRKQLLTEIEKASATEAPRIQTVSFSSSSISSMLGKTDL